jgi:hypothetical protein
VENVVGGLAEVISSLRAELSAAMEQGEEQSLRFTLAPVEVTLQVAISKQGDAKIGWSVLGIGGSVESGRTNTVTLTLTPVLSLPDGTATKEFVIADAQRSGQVRDGVGPKTPEPT